MSRTLKTRTRRLEQASTSGQETRCFPIIRATDKADADRQMEALVASGALDGWNERSLPIVRVIAPIVKVDANGVPDVAR
ncbi:hypothetical protein [Microvirga zambiensis]|uniref:hypothetical protein n=1 Tax=Microvirga zambiensis TaxID=1402137 RepID=UPI00191CBFDB|nr:hypothetical protein [Microvirga zambiensis]